MQAVKSGYMHRQKTYKFIQSNHEVISFKINKSRKTQTK